jgi:hypothetical protein
MLIRGLDAFRPRRLCGKWFGVARTRSPRLCAGENGGMTRPSGTWTSMGACTHRDLDRRWARGDIRPIIVQIQVPIGRRRSTTLALARRAQGIRKARLRTRRTDLHQRLVAAHR